jgi:UDP-N-acetylglucosamine 2-epimerase
MFGCSSIDLAARALPNPAYDNTVVVLQHPVTTEAEQARAQIQATLVAMREIHAPILWFWPGQDAGSEAAAKRLREYEHTHTHITFKRHLPAADFLSLLRSARVLVGNSSVGIREAGYLGTPVVDIGVRQSGRAHGPNVYHVPHVAQEITRAVRYQMDHGRYPQSTLYGDGTAGGRIAEALADPTGAGVEQDLGGGAGPERFHWGPGQKHPTTGIVLPLGTGDSGRGGSTG